WRCGDVEETLVGAHLELLAALLIDVRRAVHGELLDLGRKRNGPAHVRAGALRRIHDLAGRRIEDAMVERLEPDADVLTIHVEPTFCSLSDAKNRMSEIMRPPTSDI